MSEKSIIVVDVYEDGKISRRATIQGVLAADKVREQQTFFFLGGPREGMVQSIMRNTTDKISVLNEYFSNERNVVGETTRIHIEKLVAEDVDLFNNLFEGGYEIPDCTSFTVDPSVVGLRFFPIINIPRDDQCPICNEDLYGDDENPAVRVYGHLADEDYCQHKFHRSCISQYCIQQPDKCKCPVCRKEFTIDELEEVKGGGKRTKKKRSKKHSKKVRASVRRYKSKRRTRRRRY